jgi:hypothetical protein
VRPLPPTRYRRSISKSPDSVRLLKGDVIDAVAELVEKSLALVETTETEPRLRLLETTRAFALGRLAESEERETTARCHAEYYRNLFERAEDEAAVRPTSKSLADYAREIDKFARGAGLALDRSGGSDRCCRPPWMRLSLLKECRSRAKQALGVLRTGGTRSPREEMRLRAALGASTPEAPEMGAAFGGYSTLQRALATPITSCVPSGASISITSGTVGTALRCHLPKSSMIWQRVGRTQAIGCSASA